MTEALTIEAFADWLEKSPRKRFDIGSIKDCALTQYAWFLGHDGSTSGFHIKTSEGGFLTIPGLMDAMTFGRNPPETFGALAAHLRT